MTKFVKYNLLLGFILRRIWLHYTSIFYVPISVFITLFFGLYQARRFPKRLIIANSIFVFTILSVISIATHNWKYTLSISDGLENSAFLLFLLVAPFCKFNNRFLNIDNVIMWGVILGVSVAIVNRVIYDKYSLIIGDVYGWANSSIYSAFLVSFAFLKITNDKITPFSLLALFLGGIIFLMDQQRGALVSIVGVIFICSVVRLNLRSTIFGSVTLLILLFIVEFIDRRGGGFVRSIIFPAEYAESYSSGLSRLNQTMAYIEHFSYWKNWFWGAGPNFSLYESGWNDLHMGYVSFVMKWGVVTFLILILMYFPVIKRVFKFNLRFHRLSGVSELYVLICVLDATTQTTFDSVPTAYLLFIAFVGVWGNCYHQSTLTIHSKIKR
jgi:hypothetical protein